MKYKYTIGVKKEFKQSIGFKADFPILSKQINCHRLVYLDNAATSLTPKKVTDTMLEYYHDFNANIHRGIHQMSEQASLLYDKAHEKVASFINASPEGIVFTKNTTESLNLVAYSLCSNLKKGDNVVLTEMEHHSNLVPWQQLGKQNGFEIRFVPVENGQLELERMKELVDKNTRVVSVAHASNVLGTVNPIATIAKIAHEKGALLVVDAAQSVPHLPVNVKELDVDFLAFSGHKMLGPTGIGVLYGKKVFLENMKPFLYGGDMIKEVTLKETTFNDLPWKFEAGTPNIAGGIALGAAVDYLTELGMSKIHKHTQELAKKTIKMLKDLGAQVYTPNAETTGIVSFNLPKIHPHDVSSILDRQGIAIRGGHNCAMPLHKKLGVTGSCRASFYVYSTEDDIEALKTGLMNVMKVFK